MAWHAKGDLLNCPKATYTKGHSAPLLSADATNDAKTDGEKSHIYNLSSAGNLRMMDDGWMDVWTDMKWKG